MKVISTVLWICLGSILQGQALLNESSTWREQSVWAGFDGTISYSTWDVMFIGDTIIDGRTYYIPFRAGVVIERDLDDNMIIEQYPFFHQMDPIREEDGRFYQYDKNVGADILFQTFALEVGDTAFSVCAVPQVVEFIDTVFIGNSARRRFHFVNNNVTWLIEGIGSSRGLFHQPCNEIYFEGGYSLLCYSQDGEYLAVAIDSVEACQTPLATSELQAETNLNVFPNPCHDQLIVSAEEPWEAQTRFSIYNAHGCFVNITDLHFQGEICALDVSSLMPGLYQLSITANGFQQTKLFVKS